MARHTRGASEVGEESYLESSGARECSAELDGAVVVAVVAVLVVKMSLHHVIDVIAMGHREVTAARTVDMRLVVPTASMRWSATGRIRAADGERVLVDVVAVNVMEVPIMKVVEVPCVPDGRVTTANTVLVGMTFVDGMLLHRLFS